MDIDLNNIDFAIAVNTFSDDIEDKTEFLTKLEMDFLRKFEHRVKIPEHHSEMVFEIRKMVSCIEEMYKDIKDYFVEMKIPFVYEFIRKIQTLMVVGYNHLSQALLITFDMYEAEKSKDRQTESSGQECSCTNKNKYNLSKDEFKRIEHFDYAISSIENEEERLNSEMSLIFDRMMMQKNMIDKIKPSLASKELEEMKDHIETVMENNEKLFEETYMMKFFEFHNHIKTLDKPEKITEVYNSMNTHLKQNFIKQTVRTAGLLERNRKHNYEALVNVSTQTAEAVSKPKSKRDPMKDTFSMNSSILKTTQSSHFSLGKEKRMNEKLNLEIASLNKKIVSLKEELGVFKNAEHQLQENYREKCQKVSTIQEMYKKTKIELETASRETQFTIATLKNQVQFWKEQVDKVKKCLESRNSKMSSRSVQTERQANNRAANSKSIFRVTADPWDLKDMETQTHDEYLIPDKENEIVKMLKVRNERAIILLNEKDKKIRESSFRIETLEKETLQLSSSLDSIVIKVQNCLGEGNNQRRRHKDTEVGDLKTTQNEHSARKSISQFYEYEEKIHSLLKTIQKEPKNSQKNSLKGSSQEFAVGSEEKSYQANEKGKFTLLEEQSQQSKEAEDEEENEVNQLPINRLNKKYSAPSNLKNPSKLKRKISMFNMMMDSRKPPSLMQSNKQQGKKKVETVEFAIQTDKVDLKKQKDTQTDSSFLQKVDSTKRSSSKLVNESSLNRIESQIGKINTNRKSKQQVAISKNRMSENCLQSRTKLVCTPKSKFMKRNKKEFQKLAFASGNGVSEQNKPKKSNRFHEMIDSSKASLNNRYLEASKDSILQNKQTRIPNYPVDFQIQVTKHKEDTQQDKKTVNKSNSIAKPSGRKSKEAHRIARNVSQTNEVLLSVNRFKEGSCDPILEKYLLRLSQKYGLTQITQIIHKIQSVQTNLKFIQNIKNKVTQHCKNNTMPTLDQQQNNPCDLRRSEQDHEVLTSKHLIPPTHFSSRLSSKKRIYCHQKKTTDFEKAN